MPTDPDCSPEISLSNCPYRFCGENETLARLWNIALDDIEKSFNTVTEFGTVYSAGEYALQGEPAKGTAVFGLCVGAR